MSNLFAAIPGPLAAERFDVLHETRAFKLERIVSTGQATPPGQWHDQARDEWVLVLRGSAGLRFEDETEPRLLRAGDHVLIPPLRRPPRRRERRRLGRGPLLCGIGRNFHIEHKLLVSGHAGRPFERNEGLPAEAR